MNFDEAASIYQRWHTPQMDKLTVSKLMGILAKHPKDTKIYFQADGWGSDGAEFGIHADGDLIIRIDGGGLTPEDLKLVVHGFIEDRNRVTFSGRRVKKIACGKKAVGSWEGKGWDSGLVNCPDCLALREMADVEPERGQSS